MTAVPNPPAGATHFQLLRGKESKGGRVSYTRIDEENEDGSRGPMLHPVETLNAAWVLARFGAGWFKPQWAVIDPKTGKQSPKGMPGKGFEIVARKKQTASAAAKGKKPRTRIEALEAVAQSIEARIGDRHRDELRREREMAEERLRYQGDFFRSTVEQMRAVMLTPQQGPSAEVIELREKLARIQAEIEAERRITEMRAELRREFAGRARDEEEDDDDGPPVSFGGVVEFLKQNPDIISKGLEWLASLKSAGSSPTAPTLPAPAVHVNGAGT